MKYLLVWQVTTPWGQIAAEYSIRKLKKRQLHSHRASIQR